MGFYFRQSARFGPFRINFSKSGIGVSAGIPGLRIGTGPRGAYIHAGAGGLYYRQSLGARLVQSNVAVHEDAPLQPRFVSSLQHTLGAEEIIESGSVLQMRDTTGSGLVDELNTCRNRMAYAPFVLGFVIILLSAGAWKSNPALIVLALLCLPLWYWINIKDIERKGFVLQYDLDKGATKSATELVQACERMQAAMKAWYLDSSQVVLDGKYHAGASSLIKRTATRFQIKEPPNLRTNVPVPAIGMGKETLYFLPDRLLVYSGSQIGAVSYRDLLIAVQDYRFIESSYSSVPTDAEVVGKTWRYVNKNGGPDKRFKGNTELPIALYEEISLTSASGLREILHLSKRGIGLQLSSAVSNLNRATADGYLLTG